MYNTISLSMLMILLVFASILSACADLRICYSPPLLQNCQGHVRLVFLWLSSESPVSKCSKQHYALRFGRSVFPNFLFGEERRIISKSGSLRMPVKMAWIVAGLDQDFLKPTLQFEGQPFFPRETVKGKWIRISCKRTNVFKYPF